VSAAPAYRIETARLVVRAWDPRDAERLHDALAASREHLRPWLDWARDEPRPFEEHVALLRRFRARFDLDEERSYALLDRAEERVLGGASLAPVEDEDARQAGYWLAPEACGRGLATEAVAALLRCAFEVDGLARVEIRCDEDNLRSRALAERLGLRLEAVLPARTPRTAGGRVGRCVHALRAEEYPASPAASLPLAAFDVLGRALLDARAGRPRSGSAFR
jgi:RimJ/RimL family protein N-acetyltransferase